MKKFAGTGLCLSCAACMALFFLTGCATDGKKPAFEMAEYYKALEESEPANMELLEPGTLGEKETIRNFIKFYSIFSEERIKSSVRDLYADDAYFRDGFREVRGIDNIESYFLSTTEAFYECTFDIQDVAHNNGNYYFRWIMKLTLKRDRDNPLETAGMSHVRFNTEGEVVFHQDYWETSLLYERLPVIGWMIRWVKKQI